MDIQTKKSNKLWEESWKTVSQLMDQYSSSTVVETTRFMKSLQSIEKIKNLMSQNLAEEDFLKEIENLSTN